MNFVVNWTFLIFFKSVCENIYVLVFGKREKPRTEKSFITNFRVEGVWKSRLEPEGLFRKSKSRRIPTAEASLNLNEKPEIGCIK